ncbi:hypothetical protein L1987_22480 [Smallanthus sonchifolius]|uniref:Uncharacterized protein n=1 Tax=Smallanthus sonchifolius TaxID=185202 RepID=A0ACB9IFK5_9ASTR|nr:hypothetical protein L1987_22480 [Smallanthus sonchifolius]
MSKSEVNLRKDPKISAMSRNNVMRKTVMLDPYSLPGMVIVEQGKEYCLGIGISDSADLRNTVFRFVDGNEGMDGEAEL